MNYTSRKITLFSSVFVMLCSLQAENKVSDKAVKSWTAKAQVLGFQENKGQMADVDGKLLPGVLFKVAAPDLNILVTTQGLSYQFYKIEKETVEDKAQQKQRSLKNIKK